MLCHTISIFFQGGEGWGGARKKREMPGKIIEKGMEGKWGGRWKEDGEGREEE
jgi:hypothetical protein